MIQFMRSKPLRTKQVGLFKTNRFRHHTRKIIYQLAETPSQSQVFSHLSSAEIRTHGLRLPATRFTIKGADWLLSYE